MPPSVTRRPPRRPVPPRRRDSVRPGQPLRQPAPEPPAPAPAESSRSRPLLRSPQGGRRGWRRHAPRRAPPARRHGRRAGARAEPLPRLSLPPFGAPRPVAAPALPGSPARRAPRCPRGARRPAPGSAFARTRGTEPALRRGPRSMRTGGSAAGAPARAPGRPRASVRRTGARARTRRRPRAAPPGGRGHRPARAAEPSASNICQSSNSGLSRSENPSRNSPANTVTARSRSSAGAASPASARNRATSVSRPSPTRSWIVSPAVSIHSFPIALRRVQSVRRSAPRARSESWPGHKSPQSESRDRGRSASARSASSAIALRVSKDTGSPSRRTAGAPSRQISTGTTATIVAAWTVS